MSKSETLIESHIALRADKSTLKLSTKSLGKHFNSNSLICSSNIAHSLTAPELHTNSKCILV